VFHAVSSLLRCLPELPYNNIQPNTTSYPLLRRDCFNVLTNIDLLHSFRHEDTLVFKNIGL